MTEKKPNLLPIGAIVLISTLLMGLLGVWLLAISKESRKVRAREELVGAVERGNAAEVVALLERIDPEGRGTAADWIGLRELENEAGFDWLLSQWRKLDHTKGAAILFHSIPDIDPKFGRVQLIEHLRWLQSRGDRESYEELFEFALSLKFEEGLPGAPHPLMVFGENDPVLALRIWEAHKGGKIWSPLSGHLFESAAHVSNFADAVRFEHLLRLTGLLEPVESFEVLQASFKPNQDDTATWIECLFDHVSSPRSPEYEVAREKLLKGDYAKIGPEVPGLFLLRRLVQDSVDSDSPELSPAELGAALVIFERLDTKAKAGVADLIDRYVTFFGDHDALREWVWSHHREAWEEEGELFLARRDWGGNESWSSWPPRSLSRWLRSAAKNGQAEAVAPVVRHILRHRFEELERGGISNRHNDYRNHPFYCAIPHHTTRSSKERAAFLTGHFSLLLAFGRDPETPPGDWFPKAPMMGNWEEPENKVNHPWYTATAEEFNEMLTELGEPFADDPLRFLIVPCILDWDFKFSTTLPKPEVLARFQELAKENDRPGGWLSKDLAELLPRWWAFNREKHHALLASGGHSYSYDRMHLYLADKRTPVSARVSYVLGSIPWMPPGIPRTSSLEIGAAETALPEMSALALEFAREVEAGRWKPGEISLSGWNAIANDWLNEPTVPVGGGTEGDRKEARRLLIDCFGPIVEMSITAAEQAKDEKAEFIVDRDCPHLKTYAMLLCRDGRGEEIMRLWNAIEGSQLSPRKVFSWVPWDISDTRRILASIISEPVARAYNERGWESALGEIGDLDDALAYAALSEVTATLGLRDWIDFCGSTLDRISERTDFATGNCDEFFALPPAGLRKPVAGSSQESRIRQILDEVRGLVIPARNEDFFSLALPPVLRQFLGGTSDAASILRDLESASAEPVPLVIREAIIQASSRPSRSLRGRNLAALRNSAIPLAQRWVAASYFSMDEYPSYPSRIEEWDADDIALHEVGIDLLIAALDRGLPVWELADRGVGALDYRDVRKISVVNQFPNFHRLNKTKQTERVRALLQDRRIEAMLKNCPLPLLLLERLYDLALRSGDEALASDLFCEAEPGLDFEEELTWLRKGNYNGSIARLLAREWPRIDDLSIEFDSSEFLKPLPAILAAIPDDPDLHLLVRATLSPRYSLRTLVHPYANSRNGNEITIAIDDNANSIVQEFLVHRFASPEKERLCLSKLLLRADQAPMLSRWLDERLAARSWEDDLELDASEFRVVWPYWARRIEELAAIGDFEALHEMLPDPVWFDPSRTDPSIRTSQFNEDTVKELVWMGFARAVSQTLRFGSTRECIDAAAIAAHLVASPPASDGLLEIERTSTPRLTRKLQTWTFHLAALQELSLHGTSAMLLATLSEPTAVGLARSGKFLMPTIRLRSGGSRTPNVSPGALLRLLVDPAETLTQSQRQRLFLRACETPPFTRDQLARPLPWYQIAQSHLPKGISMTYLIELAEARLEEQPENTFRTADLGLVLLLAGREEEALRHLERALPLLSESRSGDVVVLQHVNIQLKRHGRVFSSKP